MNIGIGIKKYRKKTGLTQEDLAETTGLSKISISRIETGFIAPKKQTRKLIAKTLGVHEDLLYIASFTDENIKTLDDKKRFPVLIEKLEVLYR